MKKLFCNPVIALILSILLVLGSGAVSSRIRMERIASSQGVEAAKAEFEEYNIQFPGNIFLKLSGC